MSVARIFAILHLIFIIFSFVNPAKADNKKLDSLNNHLNSLPSSGDRPDTTRIKVLNEISREYIKSGDHEKAITLAEEARVLSETYLKKEKLDNSVINNLKKGIANAYHNTATVYYYKGNYDQALDKYLQSLQIRESINDELGTALSANNIGNIYNNKGDYVKALNYYLKSLKVRERLGDKKGMAASYNNIGSVYEVQKDFRKALDYFTRSLKLREEIGDKQGTALSLNNIGNVLYYTGDNDGALRNYQRSLEIRIKIDDRQGTADCYHNISNIYHKDGHVDSALTFQKKALAIRTELGDKLRMCFSYRNIGMIYLESHQPALAKEYMVKSLMLAKEVSALPDQMSNYRALAKVDSALGDFKGAYEYHKLFALVKDSILNEESTKKLVQSEMKYEFEKKEHASRLEQEKRDAINRATLRQQTLQRNAFIAGFGLMLALAVVSYRSYRNKRKSHEIIASQKAILEERNKDILDSINYAKRIQDALLKEEEHVSKHLPAHFIYFRPKDIVSGDFYWVSEKKGYLYLAVADCTGHGVPGAFMSMLGIAFLNEITATEELLTPSVVLDRLRDKIIRELSQPSSQRGSESSISLVKDGMDISLIRLDLASNRLLWSGANNPLYIIRKGSEKIEEIKPDKQPIGFVSDPKPFVTHEISLEKEDMLFLFTDGYADQFGGEKGKKFKYSQLKEMLLKNSSMDLSAQKDIMDTTFNKWKGNLEQVDDVCVIGLRL